MKKVFTSLLLVSQALLAFGQKDTVWSAQKTGLYGSKAEYKYEENLKSKSESGFLYRFAGFKREYAKELPAFIQAKMNYVLKGAPSGGGANSDYVLVSNEVYKGKIPPKKMVVSFVINEKSDRIVSGSITGKFYELSNIFVNYWPKDPSFAGEIPIKQGLAAVKHSNGDLISFIWNGADPSITITKDPDTRIPFPPFK
jgi:hypothetical protein